MGLLLLIPGIILLATSGWFKDQHKVGEILTIIGGALLLIQVVWFTLVATKVNREFNRRF
jgi:uncharacterized membrane protein